MVKRQVCPGFYACLLHCLYLWAVGGSLRGGKWLKLNCDCRNERCRVKEAERRHEDTLTLQLSPPHCPSCCCFCCRPNQTTSLAWSSLSYFLPSDWQLTSSILTNQPTLKALIWTEVEEVSSFAMSFNIENVSAQCVWYIFFFFTFNILAACLTSDTLCNHLQLNEYFLNLFRVGSFSDR